MANTADVMNTDITFAKQLNGYDKEQVDCYVHMLAKAYKTAFEKHNALCVKYNNLLKKYTEIEKNTEHDNSNAQVISRTLIDAEMMAQNIIAAARSEAEKIKGDAYIEKLAAKRSVEAANESLLQVIGNLQGLMLAR